MGHIKVVIAHPGTQHAHKLAAQLVKRGLLYKFITGLVIVKHSLLHRIIQVLPQKIAKSVSNRVVDNLPNKSLQTCPLLEIKALRASSKASNRELVFFDRNKKFQQKISDKLLAKANVIIGFDTSSWILAKRCQSLNKKFILDVSIAHSASKNEVYKSIVNAFPEWSSTVETKDEALLKLESEEYALATRIVVASSFSKKTLIANGVPENKINVNPYGIDINRFKQKEVYIQHQTIRFLFVGLVDARKGIPFLLDTIQSMHENIASYSLVGSINAASAKLIDAYKLPNVHVLGKVPHADIHTVFAEHDVFVFPSYFEGFGLVILEAMACGLPVIITNATAGTDCVEDGKEGFVIEAGNRQQLQNAIQYFIDNPTQIEVMGRAARKNAEQFTWDAYGDRWQKIIEQVAASN